MFRAERRLTRTAPTAHSVTPAAVSMLGVTRVRARPVIERDAIALAPPVYASFRLMRGWCEGAATAG